MNTSIFHKYNNYNRKQQIAKLNITKKNYVDRASLNSSKGHTHSLSMTTNNKNCSSSLDKSRTNNQKQIKVNIAAFLPTVLNTLVVPAFLLPFSLTSNPAIFLLKIIAKLTLPIRYAINPTNMYTADISIPPCVFNFGRVLLALTLLNRLIYTICTINF